MGAIRNKRQKEYREAALVRMSIVAQLWRRHYTYRQIQEEVKARLDLQTYSLRTVGKDIERCIEEWKAQRRIEDTDAAIQLELARIDDVCRQAWEAWEKSKQDGDKTRTKQTGVVPKGDNGDNAESGEIQTVKVERTSEEQTNCGDPRYLDIICKCAMERRKLLGLYSPDKKEVSGSMSFTDLLMQTGIVENEGQ